MNVVALAGIPGISIIAVTHGLGGPGGLPPINPLLYLGGGEDETFDDYLGYFKSPSGKASAAAWEMEDGPYVQGRRVSLGAFTARALSEARAVSGGFAQAENLAGGLLLSGGMGHRLVQVIVSAGGAREVTWRLIKLD